MAKWCMLRSHWGEIPRGCLRLRHSIFMCMSVKMESGFAFQAIADIIKMGHHMFNIFWLVVSTPLKNMLVSWDDYSQYMEKIKCMFQTTKQFFPTCQVRVVRFYQSACPPPPPPRLAVLLALLLASASSTSTSALPTLPTRHQAIRQLPSSVRTAGRQPASCPAQCAPLDLNLRAAQLSVHRWTSTCELPSSVCTAGPSTGDLPSSVCTAGRQPASCPAQCAPLDLNLRAAQLSVHRWTSTCELPSSVCTAGPQPASCPAQCAPLDLNLRAAQLSVHRWTSTAR